MWFTFHDTVVSWLAVWNLWKRWKDSDREVKSSGQVRDLSEGVCCVFLIERIVLIVCSKEWRNQSVFSLPWLLGPEVIDWSWQTLGRSSAKYIPKSKDFSFLHTLAQPLTLRRWRYKWLTLRFQKRDISSAVFIILELPQLCYPTCKGIAWQNATSLAFMSHYIAHADLRLRQWSNTPYQSLSQIELKRLIHFSQCIWHLYFCWNVWILIFIVVFYK